jgi:hypothetical protein
VWVEGSGVERHAQPIAPRGSYRLRSSAEDLAERFSVSKLSLTAREQTGRCMYSETLCETNHATPSQNSTGIKLTVAHSLFPWRQHHNMTWWMLFKNKKKKNNICHLTDTFIQSNAESNAVSEKKLSLSLSP